MQMLLNKNLLNEIEQILTKKQDGVGNKSIVKQINEYLDKFIEQQEYKDNYTLKKFHPLFRLKHFVLLPFPY